MKRTVKAPKKNQLRKKSWRPAKNIRGGSPSEKHPTLMAEEDLDHLGELHDEAVHPERH